MPWGCTNLVLVVWVQIYTAPLRFLPVCGNAVVYIRLVYDLGDQLRTFVDGGRVWRRKLGARNCVLGAVEDEQSEEGPDTVNGETQYNHGGHKEYEDSAPHDGGFVDGARPRGRQRRRKDVTERQKRGEECGRGQVDIREG